MDGSLEDWTAPGASSGEGRGQAPRSTQAVHANDGWFLVASIRDLARAVHRSPKRDLARTLARAPLEAEASRLLAALPVIELVDLAGGAEVPLTLAPSQTRHSWSLGALEQVVLQALVSSRGVQSAFEIGTFNGGTTRVIAEALPSDGRVVTLDLPPTAFDATQRPADFTGDEVGRAYASSPAAAKVTQLLEDSLAFDPSPFEGQFDLVLVDGGHEYEHGCSDTATALRLVAPGESFCGTTSSPTGTDWSVASARPWLDDSWRAWPAHRLACTSTNPWRFRELVPREA